MPDLTLYETIWQYSTLVLVLCSGYRFFMFLSSDVRGKEDDYYTAKEKFYTYAFCAAASFLLGVVILIMSFVLLLLGALTLILITG